MTVREIIEGLDVEIRSSRAQVLRLETCRQRIMECVKQTPAPAAEPVEEGVIKLCDHRAKKKPAKRAA